MNSDNIRSYAVGRIAGRELLVHHIQSIGCHLWSHSCSGTSHRTLPEAIEAGKAYLIANGGEVYDHEDAQAKRIEELEAENKRLRELAKAVVQFTGTRIKEEDKERLRSEILNTAMNLLLKPELPKEQPE